jgi:hypothetical protein
MKAKFFGIFLTSIFLLASGILFPVSTFAADDIFISEIAFTSSTLHGHDKWFELYNPTGIPISLDQYSISTRHTTKPTILSGVIGSRETFLISTKYGQKPSIFNGFSTTNLQLPFNPMTFISNTSEIGKRYVELNLLKNGQVISSLKFDDSYVANNITNFSGSKGSIECDSLGVCIDSKTEFVLGNFGSPGVFANPTTIKPIPVAETVPVDNQLEITTVPQLVLENVVTISEAPILAPSLPIATVTEIELKASPQAIVQEPDFIIEPKREIISESKPVPVIEPLGQVISFEESKALSLVKESQESILSDTVYRSTNNYTLLNILLLFGVTTKTIGQKQDFQIRPFQYLKSI